MSSASSAAAAMPTTIQIQVSEVEDFVVGTVVVVLVEVEAGTVVVGRDVRVVGGLVELVVVVGRLVVVVVVVVVVAGTLVLVDGSGGAAVAVDGPKTKTQTASSGGAKRASSRCGRRRGARGHGGRVPGLDAQVIVAPRLSERGCSAAMLTAAARATRALHGRLECERVGPFGPTLSRNPPGCSVGPRAGRRKPTRPAHVRQKSYRHLGPDA